MPVKSISFRNNGENHARNSMKSMSKINQLVVAILFVSVALVSYTLGRFHSQLQTSIPDTLFLPPLEKLVILSKKDSENVAHPDTSGLEQTTSKATILSDNKVSSLTSESSSCLQWNTQEWLNGVRFGNTVNSYLTDQFVVDTILGTHPVLLKEESVPILLQQSLCHEKSRFLTWADDHSDDKNLHFWTLRLIYLAFHINQHGPAVKEALARRASPETCKVERQKHVIGNYDYECPDRKFLVVTMGKLGLGAVMRLGAVNALIAGVATNRTVLFVNNSPTGPEFIRDPWVHASCERADFQCFFLPITPCVPLEKDLKDLYVLERPEQRKLFKSGEIPPEHQNKKMVGVNFILRPQRMPPTFRNNTMAIMNSFVDELSERHWPDLRIQTLKKAAKLILVEEPDDPSRPYVYIGGKSKVNHAAVFYTMRPHPVYSKIIDKNLEKIFPKDFNPENALGLPIRASDKCIRESECLSFDQYMKLMGQVRKRHDQALLGGTTDIVLTSESEHILNAKKEYETNLTKKNLVPFDYRFVTNDGDVMQGTGLPKEFQDKRPNVTANEIMLSAITSLKAQLMPRFSIGNCCSSFHLLIFDFLRDGCGAARDNIGQCLQENEDPEFRVCCGWSKTEECRQKKEAAHEAKAQQ